MELGEEAKALRELYDARIRNLTAFIHAAGDAIRADDVIAVMRADPLTAPFAEKRGRELWANALAQEREATISRLLTELAEGKRTLRALEDRLSATQREMREAEADKARYLSRDAETFHQKASLTSRSLEEALRKRETEAQASLAKGQSELEAVKLAYEKLEAEVSRKAEELEGAYQELAECNEVIRQLEQDLEAAADTAARQEERLQFHETLSIEFQAADAHMQDRMNALTSDVARAQAELAEVQTQRDNLQLQLQQESESHRQQQIALDRLRSDTERQLEQRFASDVQSLREKAATWRSRCQDYELQLQESARSLEAVRAHWQGDVSRLKSEQDRSIQRLQDELSAAERSSRLKEHDLHRQHKDSEDALHTHYKALLQDRIRAMETERSSDREQWKVTERSLNDRLNSALDDMRTNYLRVQDHELVLAEKEEAVSLAVKRAEEHAGSEWTARMREEADKAAAELQATISALTARIKACEADKDAALLETRKLSDDLRVSHAESDKQRAELAGLSADLTSSRKTSTELASHVEQQERETAQLTTALEQARLSESELASMRGRLEHEVSTLHDRLRSQELAHKAALNDQAAAAREERRLLESECEQFRQLSDQVRKELSGYKDACNALELEVTAARNAVVQAPIAVVKLREDERRAEPESRHSVTDVELRETRSNLTAIQKTHNDLKDHCTALEEKLRLSESARIELESSLQRADKLLKALRMRADAKGPKIQALSKQIRMLKVAFHTELTRLQSDVFRLLQEGQQGWTMLSARGVAALDEQVVAFHRDFRMRLAEREDALDALETRFARLKADSEEQSSERDALFQRELSKAKEEKLRVQVDMSTVQSERKDLVFQLEQLRTEGVSQAVALRDAQGFIRALQAEEEETAALQRELQERNGRLERVQRLSREQAAEVQTLREELGCLQQLFEARVVQDRVGPILHASEGAQLDLQVEDLVAQARHSMSRLRVPEPGSEARPYRQRPLLR